MFRDNFSGHRKFHPAKVFFFISMAALFVVFIGGIVMWLWNAILPDLLGVKEINFWQAVGLLILSRILFGGYHFGGSHKKHHSARRRQWREKWMNMSEEERAVFKEKWRGKC